MKTNRQLLVMPAAAKQAEAKDRATDGEVSRGFRRGRGTSGSIGQDHFQISVQSSGVLQRAYHDVPEVETADLPDAVALIG